MTRTAKEVAATIRAELKRLGIKARCRVAPGAKDIVQVYVPKFDQEFTEVEQRAIRSLGVELGLTWVRGLPINVEQMTNPHDMNFYLPEWVE
ncbi:hypothetical protein [Amycolatopsis anabasis]|uniref:hypothetical protein n=1 Tax=Amycolatopsis anabasis TaxID=1840409 RepID=UPI00131B8365|nr:hypothetical protein [Amycolatopsis anabasis]